MPRISMLADGHGNVHQQAAMQQIVESHGRMTNMKRTLAHDITALDALMTWYPLREAILPFLGDRATTLLVHAISTETECLICSTFFRRWLIDAGENPDALELDPREQTLVEFGRRLATPPHRLNDELFARLRAHFDERQIVLLTAFGGLMIATNVFNNALEVELDDYLEPYRRKGGVK